MATLPAHHMVKIGYQKHTPQSQSEPRPSTTMDRFLTRPTSPALHLQADLPSKIMLTRQGRYTYTHTHGFTPSQIPASQFFLTPKLLDEKLQTLLHRITHNIVQEVGKISQELRGELDQLGEHSDVLETKFDYMVCTCLRRG